MSWVELEANINSSTCVKDELGRWWRKFKVDVEFIPTILQMHRAVGVPRNTPYTHTNSSRPVASYILRENQSPYARAAVTNAQTSGVKLMAAGIVEIRSQSVIRRSERRRPRADWQKTRASETNFDVTGTNLPPLIAARLPRRTWLWISRPKISPVKS